MQQLQQQERRAINEGIEATYMDLSGISAGIRTHYQSGRGVIGEMFQELHFHIGILVEATEVFEDMEPSQPIIDQLNAWLDLPPVTDKEMRGRCMEGLRLVKEYKKALTRCGLVSLPSRGR